MKIFKNVLSFLGECVEAFMEGWNEGMEENRKKKTNP